MQTLDLQKTVIYGPVNSRRLGRSLGVNLLPATQKVCTMNCCYCQYGWTAQLSSGALNSNPAFPSAEQILFAVQDAYMKGDDFDYLTFSGNGEPTLHPAFSAIVAGVKKLKSYFHSEAQIALLSNSTTCSNPEIQSTIESIDLPIMKLDAGNAVMFRRINHAHATITFEDILEGLKSLTRFDIQSMFVRGAIDNSTAQEVESWIDTIKYLNPLRVQIYSLDRYPANGNLKRVEKTRLYRIAERAQKKTGIKVAVF